MQSINNRTALLMKIVFLFSLLQLTGCAPAPVIFNYYQLESNPPGAKIYRGRSPDSLSYYQTTPFLHKTKAPQGLGWSKNYFQAKKEGYKDSEVFYQPQVPHGSVLRVKFDLKKAAGEAELAPFKRRNTLQAYYEFLNQYPDNTIKDKVFGLMVALIPKTSAPAKEYGRLADKYPSSIQYMPASVRLSYVGPEGMKVSDIIGFKKKGIGDAILEQKILSAGKPYTEFSFDEIQKLTAMGLTDKVIAAMLKVTKEYNDKEAAKKLAAQKSKNQTQARAAAPAAQTGGSAVGDKLQECAVLIAKKKACDQIGGFGGMACMAMIPGGHNCF